MHKIRDNAKEWRKFAALMAALGLAAVIYHAVRGNLAKEPAILIGVGIAILCGLVLAFPRVIRLFYLGWMTIGHWLGQIMGRVLLTIMFVLVVIPLGILLRSLGKDLLQTRKVDRDSYWEKPSRQENLERLF